MATLYCPTCEVTYEPGLDEPWRCENGHPLKLRATASVGQTTCSDRATRDSLWRFTDRISVPCHVTLGEGCTPEIRSDRFGCTFKLEYISPSASFKDRGVTTMLSRAVELGVSTVVEDSSGNAGSAVAQYAAKAGIEAKIYVPAAIPESKHRAIVEAGATVVPVEGTRGDVSKACIDAAEMGEGWYASHNWRPSFLAGTQTIAYEIIDLRDGAVPDSIVLPMGAGTLFLGAAQGFSRLVDAGVIDAAPRLIGAQAAGYAPIADAAKTGDQGDRNEIADGLQTSNPPRREELLEVAEREGNAAVAISEADTKAALNDLRHEGFFVEPTSAVAPAAYRRCLTEGVLDEADEVVVALSGSGLNAL